MMSFDELYSCHVAAPESTTTKFFSTTLQTPTVEYLLAIPHLDVELRFN